MHVWRGITFAVVGANQAIYRREMVPAELRRAGVVSGRMEQRDARCSLIQRKVNGQQRVIATDLLRAPVFPHYGATMID